MLLLRNVDESWCEMPPAGDDWNYSKCQIKSRGNQQISLQKYLMNTKGK